MNKEIEELTRQVEALRKDEQELHRQEYNRLITTEQRDERLGPVEQEIMQLNEKLLFHLIKRQQDFAVAVDKKQDHLDNVKKRLTQEKRKGILAGRKRDPKSYLSLIIKALSAEKYNSLSKVADYVDMHNPGRERHKTVAQIKATIYRVMKQEPGIYQNYKWNEDRFLLEEKNVKK